MTTPTQSPANIAPFEAVLLYSFGGPNAPQDVLPFLRNVTAGKGIPDSRLAEVGEHYYGFGGKSPINEQNLALKAALEHELQRRGLAVPVVWGNRNWEPFTDDALSELEQLHVSKAAMLITSAYASYSGCRQYREDMAQVQRLRGDISQAGELQEGGVEFFKVRPYFNHPGFVDASFAAISEALTELTGSGEPVEHMHLAFVTHSIPLIMEEGSALRNPASYSGQHLSLARAINERLRDAGTSVEWSLSYCSRSGPPTQPWLEPDVNDHLAELAAQGVTHVVLAPIGFISDHMEVAYDLDTEALATCKTLGIKAVRADTVGVRQEFVAGLVDLLLERAALARGEETIEASATDVPALHSVCPVDCCLRVAGQPSNLPVVACE